MESSNLKSNLKNVISRIEKACKACSRSPEEVTLVAVSKTKPVADIEAVRALGQIHFGENKVQELVPKMEHFAGDKNILWHMVGGLQSNKIKYLTDEVDWIDSVPKLKALKEINKRALASERVINVLIQVNISDEDQKFGCEPDDLPALIKAGEKMPNVVIRGLMGIASLEEDLENVRPQFRKLRELLDQEKAKGYERATLDHLSMGMTNDMEVAIEEGATMIRVGSAIFGPR